MSKREGTYVTLDELVDQVGVDATRFFFAMRSASQHLDFDLDLARRQSNDNPVYYVQYAHARCASILRQPEAAAADAANPSPDFTLLVHPAEQALIRTLLRLPEVIADAADRRETHDLPRYAMDVAGAFSAFYRDCRVLSEDSALSASRLAVVRATRQVLANSLGLIGVSAPDTM